MANDVADDERVDGSGDGAGCTEGIGRHYFTSSWANWRLFIGYEVLGAER